jgi:hypothetical protein
VVIAQEPPWLRENFYLVKEQDTMRWRSFVVCAVIGLAGLSTPAWATDLGPGGTVTPTAVNNPLTQSGYTIEATTSGTFSTPVESGTYSAYVVRTDTGTLDFVYKFANDSSSESKIERMSAYNFSGFQTNVGYVSGSGDVNPGSADRTTDGEVVGFNFLATGIDPGRSTAIMVIATNATQYKAGTYTFQDGGATTVAAYAPALGTPEPSSLLFAGFGSVLLLGLVRRRRKLSSL